MPIPVAKSRPIQLERVRKFPNAKCEVCPLYTGRVTQTDIIPATDGSKPRIMALGEGPAAEEAALGLPFQGDAGKILREAIKDRDLEKHGVVLDNAVACDTRILQRSWSDDDESTAVKRAKFKDAINACKDRLWDSVDKHEPELIIILGNIAKEAIVPEVREGIMKLAGNYHKTDDGYEMIFNYHPAFLLHAREGERFITEFLTNLNEARLFFDAKAIDSPVIVCDTVAKAKKAIKALTNNELIAADVETTGFSPYEDGWTINPPATDVQKAVAIAEGYTLQDRKLVYFGRLLSVQLCGDNRIGYVFPSRIAVDEKIKPLLSHLLQTEDLLAHNAPFDIPWLVRYFGDRVAGSIEAKHDTMLMSLSMNENPGHSLKKLGREELGYEDWSEETDFWRPKRSTSFANIPPEVLYPYGGYDVISTINLVQPLKGRQNNDDARLYNDWLMPVSRMFTKASIRGTSIDIGLMAKTSGFLESERKRLAGFLLDNYGLKNPNASQQVQRILLDAPEDGGFHMDFPDNVTTGKATLEGLRVDGDEADFEDWEWDLSEFSKGVLDYRTAYKARNTYMKDVAGSVGWKDLEKNGKQLIGKVHPDFKLFSQVTGRVSINNPTLINYSKGTRFSEHIRNYFIPRPGYAWFHADYKNFELRVFASMMKDDDLREIFLGKMPDGSDRDPHREAGIAIYGEDFDALNKRAYGMLRVITKQCVFGRLYNRGHEAIAEQLEIEIEESERICNVIDNFFGKLGEYREMVFDMVFSTQKLVNPIGRTRRFPLITRSNQKRIENMAVNYLIQSTASDLNLIAVNQVTLEMPDVFPLFTIHDSCEFEIPLDKVDEYKPRIIDILEQYPRRYFPDADIPMQVDADVFNFWQADDKTVLETPVLFA